MTHALPLIAPVNQMHWRMFEKSHRFAARLTCNNYIAPYTDLLTDLNWKPISRISVERQLLVMYKWLSQLRFIPDYLLVEKRIPRIHLDREELHNRQMVVNDEFHPLGTVRLRAQTRETPLHYIVEVWNLLSAGVPDFEFNEFKRHIRKLDTFTALENAGTNRYNNKTIPALNGSYKYL